MTKYQKNYIKDNKKYLKIVFGKIIQSKNKFTNRFKSIEVVKKR